MSDIVLGIDLGTTNSVVAVADGGQARVLADADGKRLIPSVVSFPESGPVVVGEIARERRLVDAEHTIYAIKRLIGRPFDSPEVERAKSRFAFPLVEGENRGVRVEVRGETYSLAEISAYVLRECRRVAEQMLGASVDKAVITVPANFNELQRSATKAAGKVAGLEVLRILNEPTAAAVAYGAGTSGSERIAVYDFGGGTFDITILDLDDDVFEVVATAGDTFLGGDDIDLLVAEAMSDAFHGRHGIDPRQDRQAFERLRAAGEWVKCSLSGDEKAECRVSELAVGSAGEPLDLEHSMTRAELEERILPLVNQSLRVCAEALRLGDVERESIDAVVLVGGSTRIPLVRRMVRNFFEKEPRTDIDPDMVVALGAAIQGYALSARTPRDTLSIVSGPSPEAAAELRKKKEEARAARPAQPAFAPDVADGPVGELPESRPPARPRPLTLPRLPVPVPHDGGAAQPYRPPAPPDAPRPLPEAPEPDPFEAASSIELDPEYEAHVKSIAPGAFREESTEELALDLDLDDLALEELAPPEPDAPSPPARPEGTTPFDDMLAGPPPPAPPPPAVAKLPPARPVGLPAAEAQRQPARPMELLAPEPPRPPPPEPVSVPPPPQPVVRMPERPPPLLMDVTPHSLGIETVGGYCERVIRRNAPIPIEQTRVFSTAQDDQDTVRVTVCQGDSRMFADNQPLGEIELTELRRARRGEVRIEVTFMLDANGILDVKAVDLATGRVQTIRVNLLGGFDEDEMAAMRARQEASLG